ncbi:MAG: right-handed parallel beta-helix repeat-containing protein [Candidatus Latescibacter sp.]|nr:right-handed parallel beta-helix repeat-containing protein [Candidatus Latescibacter sp.]
MRRIFRLIPVLSALFFLTVFSKDFAYCAQPAAFYVSPSGNDSWSGTKAEMTASDGPFATISRAKEAVCALKAQGKPGPVTVYLRGGVYELSGPLVFKPEDSGVPGEPILYTAYRGETPIISGGKKIIGFSKSENGVWTVTLPEVKTGKWYFRQLFVNGKRCIRARTPNEGFFQADGDITMDDRAKFKYRANEIRAEWAQLKDVEVVALQAWAEFRMLIREVDASSKTVTLSAKCAPSNREKDARYWIENAPEALDAPGEFFLDRNTGVLSYIPRHGEDMARAEAVAPVLDELIRFDGDLSAPNLVSHIRFRGIAFEYTDWTLPVNGYVDMQAAYDIPATIRGNGAADISIEDCIIRRHGNYGIEFARGCRNVRIVGCEISDMGAGGVKIGEPAVRTAEQDKTFGNTVADCHVHHIGEVYPAACGIIIFQSSKNTIAHNHIHDTYYTGISNGWTWGYGPTNAGFNIIEYNHVHDIGRGMLSDMGGNYNLGVQPGTVIRNNLFHDITSYGYGGWGIYTDEGSSNILIENNLVYRTKSGGFHQHYGRMNTIRNNIFAFAVLGQIIRTRMEQHLSFTFEHNIVYWTESPLLGSNWKDDRYKMDYNAYWNPKVPADSIRFAEWNFAEWKARGQDVHSLIADPRFVDPQKGNFTLQQDSPAFKLGFKPLDLRTVGPRKK